MNYKDKEENTVKGEYTVLFQKEFVVSVGLKYGDKNLTKRI
ncbi:hypothetical protein F220043C3_16190 [Enterocloster asparagiformis]